MILAFGVLGMAQLLAMAVSKDHPGLAPSCNPSSAHLQQLHGGDARLLRRVVRRPLLRLVEVRGHSHHLQGVGARMGGVRGCITSRRERAKWAAIGRMNVWQPQQTAAGLPRH